MHFDSSQPTISSYITQKQILSRQKTEIKLSLANHKFDLDVLLFSR